MKFLLVSCLMLAVFSESAFSADQPFMRSALKNLQKAAEVPPPESKRVINRAIFLKSAQEDLAKAPSIYEGRKFSASKFMQSASEQLKAGHEAEAIAAIKQAIIKVQEGIDIFAKESSKAKASKSDQKRDNFTKFFGKAK